MHLYEDYMKTTKQETEPSVEKVDAKPMNGVSSQDLEDMKKALTEMIQETNKTTKQELLDFLRHEKITNVSEDEKQDEKQDDVEDKVTNDNGNNEEKNNNKEE